MKTLRLVGAHPVRDSRWAPVFTVRCPDALGSSPMGVTQSLGFSGSANATWLVCDRRESPWDGELPDRCRGPGYFSLFGQREVTKRKATPMPRPCGVAGGRRGGSTGRPALTIHWPASVPATLRAIPPPACSRHRGGKVKGQSRRAGSSPCRSAPSARPQPTMPPLSMVVAITQHRGTPPCRGRALGALLQR